MDLYLELNETLDICRKNKGLNNFSNLCIDVAKKYDYVFNSGVERIT